MQRLRCTFRGTELSSSLSRIPASLTRSYAAFLRGVNVGGANRLNMAELRDWMLDIGFQNVRSYIQSGNLVFRDPQVRTPAELEGSLQAGLRKRFSLEVPVLLRSQEELEALIAEAPFDPRTEAASHCYVTLLKTELPGAMELPEFRHPDRLMAGKRELYLYLPGGYGRTRWNNAFWEHRLAQPASTRNWQTLNVMLDLLREG